MHNTLFQAKLSLQYEQVLVITAARRAFLTPPSLRRFETSVGEGLDSLSLLDPGKTPYFFWGRKTLDNKEGFHAGLFKVFSTMSLYLFQDHAMSVEFIGCACCLLNFSWNSKSQSRKLPNFSH